VNEISESPDLGVRSQGPFDESEVDFSQGNRIDLGGLMLTVTDGLELQVQADQKSGRITQLTLKDGNSGMQIHPYAARKSGGMWEEVRLQIKQSVNDSGGLVEEVSGPWGIELNAQIMTNGEKPSLQPARFVGIDGPRWFLRAVFLGEASRDAKAGARLMECLRSSVVVRGDTAMAPGAPIVLRLPNNSQSSEIEPGTPIPSPFDRGPEITETR
jgi:hypothetical protein